MTLCLPAVLPARETLLSRLRLHRPNDAWALLDNVVHLRGSVKPSELNLLLSCIGCDPVAIRAEKRPRRKAQLVRDWYVELTRVEDRLVYARLTLDKWAGLARANTALLERLVVGEKVDEEIREQVERLVELERSAEAEVAELQERIE